MRENIYILDNAPGWIEGGAVVNGFIWCVRNGAIIAGSDSVPSVIPVPQTGDLYIDIADWLLAYFNAATGDPPAGIPIIDPPAVFVNGWGVVGLTAEGPGGQRPGMYLWAGESYDFGTLNLPPQVGVNDYRDWFIKFEAQVFASESVPPWKSITDYIAAEGANPILHVAELKSIE
jgi:hypothetical protein